MKIIKITAALLLLTACAPKEITTQDTKNNEIVVDTEQAKKSNLVNTTELSGIAMPDKQVPIVAPTPLEVEKVHVSIGDEVKKGDLLVSLDASNATTQLREAKQVQADLNKAVKEAESATSSNTSQTDLDKLQTELNESMEKSQALLEGTQTGAVTPLDLMQSSLDVTLKQARVAQQSLSQLVPTPDMLPQLKQQQQQANQAVAQAEQLVKATRLTAPINGIVAEVGIVEGGMAAPNIPVVTIVDQRDIAATFQVNSYQISQLKSGNNAIVKFDGINQEFPSTINTVSPTADPQTNLFTVKIPVSNEQNLIKGGMKATAMVTIDSISGALVIPKESILYEENKPYVFVAKDDRVARTPISLGFSSGDVYQVVEGLAENDVIVTNGKERLKDGDTIKERKE
ncbi:efflux RND transporter periplasmic adaptor subunit [Metabacillus iocasae]|uniref:RND family efflux transporter MFP subunit n=1 Tax=Priestia iocasae TaxID=2291674 RepID=A0ABS2QVQ9_9BACI|nr:efflux RND transporter periplasmic adaptor subunit [Metabacillus iocasae]MBM7702559.1 RND family efflux transporter MFP subunit [Metabacillus iocasae]